MILTIYYFFNLLILLVCYPIIIGQLKDIRENVPVLQAPTNIQGEENVGSRKNNHLVFIGESTMAALGMPSHKEAFAGTFARNIASSTNTNISWKVYAKNGITAAILNVSITATNIIKAIILATFFLSLISRR